MNVVKYSEHKLNNPQRAELDSVMRSWRTVYARTHTLEDSEENVKLLGQMLVYEATNPNGPRAQVMTRVHMRLNAMRQRLEYSHLISRAKR